MNCRNSSGTAANSFAHAQQFLGMIPKMTKIALKSAPNPYDEYPYCDYPIKWTAPEQLALASILHGGPRLPLDNYRVLELGCANGANLLPLAWYRRQGDFTGLDASSRQLAVANESRDKLGLSNLRFVHSDFRTAKDKLEGPYDIIMAHGVFSWITHEARDAMLEMCASLLARQGLLYLNYNSHPGWTVRGMVRDFLMRHTQNAGDLKQRAELCQEIAAKVIAPLQAAEHSYSQLLGNEFRMVINQNPAYIAHEYLSPENNAYWRDEFFSLLKDFGFDYIADADFNSVSNRITTEFAHGVRQTDVSAQVAESAADLICYRQMQSPVLTHAPVARHPCGDPEFAGLFMASNLQPLEVKEGEYPSFKHESGQEIQTYKDSISQALLKLQPLWPRGLRINSLFTDMTDDIRQDIEWLLHYQLIELRCVEPGEFEVAPDALNELEMSLRNCATTPWHTVIEKKETT
jgi:cyclopropane fatty-acyl-phospholipid synthase-like methyltransferase